MKIILFALLATFTSGFVANLMIVASSLCGARMKNAERPMRWSRLFGQFFRFDEWNLCRG
jgi:hypothetical protein